MRLLSLLVSFVCLTRTAIAGGYPGALERVWLYYAYQIDQLRPENERTLGFKCAKPNGASGWPPKASECPIGGTGKDEVRWRSCAELERVARCNFAQLNHFLGGSPANKNFVGTDPQTRTPNIEDTAKNYYTWCRSQPGKGNNGKDGGKIGGKVGNYPPYGFLKGSNALYNTFIHEVGNQVAACGQYRDANQELFKGFADSADKIVEARRGDHGPYLIEHFNTQDYIRDGTMTLATEDVGPGRSPVNDNDAGTAPRDWRTVDYGNTLKTSKLEAEASNQKIVDTLDAFYTTDRDAKDHKAVVKAFNDMSIKARQC